ncbi:transcriptional regulator [Lonepinella koalarum]|nr:transcriptional regulator [Lonepinella koalarum]MDH2927551.1 transcriptional regulator [Lonepinella koalarum]TFJ89693.1 transcriptional regulator [Lonepinella koalarum]TYG35652.1 transcriptional regulator [Lonepinella koalarum]
MSITSAKALSQIIREFRYQANLSQMDVAKRAATKQATISVFENTPESTKLDTLFKILMALELELIVQPRPTKGQMMPNKQSEILTELSIAEDGAKYNVDDEIW